MRWLALTGMLLASSTFASARIAELPQEMVGYWIPIPYNGNDWNPDNWPGSLRRIAKDAYEWEVTPTQWTMWDGICKIHDVKELGEMDYEVSATCGIMSGNGPYEMEMDHRYYSNHSGPTEEHYQFTLCGETLNIRELKDKNLNDRPAKPEGCKIS